MADQEQDDADALEGEHDGSYSEDGVRRPMNAFFIFCKRHRDVVREKYPHLENRSITKILGEWWANLDASEKSSYTALAKQYKEAFLKAHPDFKWYKLPTPPTRTLVTRPSNNRCLQSKKDKTVSKTSPCGIALGKLADEEQLGGLSSLITPPTSDSSSAPEIHDTPSSSSSSSQPTSSNNLLKPPKKRYLVNGEFKCHPESLESLTYDSRDHQTQNACSALLELAEICASSANHTSSASETSVTSNYQSLFDSLANTTSTSTLLSKPSVMLKDLTSSSAVSLPETSPQTSGLSPHTKHFIKPVASLSSSMFPVSDSYVQQLQDQPLNLCKGKEKTFTARNQQLIDHFVDKFLCDSPSCPSTPSKPTLESSISDFTSARLPNLSKNPAVCQGFTLSAAIESAIDQAYSKDIPVSPKQNKSETEPTKTDDKAKEETVFIDKIKKACLASSRNLTEKQTASINTLSTIKGTPQKAEPSDNKTEGALVNQTKESLTTTTTCVPDSSTSDVKLSTSSSFKREIKFISSSKYYSKFGSPPKKSRVWCNLFMKEQLKNSDGDGSLDEKSLMFDIASPVRRNSARTCKGRRYQALITEGLLQSSKERKGNAGKKPLPSNDKIKTRQSTSAESPPIKTKKKKRDASDKNKSPPKEESVEGDKNIFNLNEKIASLPKCSIEMLNKKKKSGMDSVSSSKPSGNVSVSSAKKSSKAESNNDAKANEASVQSQQNDSSSGRFKSGNFDLEQHIASLPKCDIEVLNKRRSKRE